MVWIVMFIFFVLFSLKQKNVKIKFVQSYIWLLCSSLHV